jgi:hypothetical protein
LDAISEQSKFLNRYQLDTGEQVESLKGKLSKQLLDLQGERKILSNEKRRSGLTDERMKQVQSEYAKVSSLIKEIRSDIKLCDDVLERSLLIAEKNRQIHELEQTKNQPQKKDPSRQYFS